MAKKSTRTDMLKALGLDENTSKTDISDKILQQLYIQSQNIQDIQHDKPDKKDKKSNPKKPKKTKYPKLKEDHPKYILTLDFLNAILKALGKTEIEQLSDFKDIYRSDLLSAPCKLVLETYMDRILDIYDKKTISYSKRNTINTYILTVLRIMVRHCGYVFKLTQKTEYVKTDNGRRMVDVITKYTAIP